MNIGNEKVVSITYKLQEGNKSGEVVQEVDSKEPFVFLFGTQQVLPDFEINLKDKSIGDTFEFGIASDKAYGPVDDNAVVNLPRNMFEADGKLGEIVKVGNFLPMKDQEGNPLQGLVKEITDEHVRMDFNHPMAGKDLFFSGEVIEVREATAEELAHGHVHGPGGHQH
ncbi:FKBP-type peptidyl prolyl cis-trans isomerase /Apo-metallochaperone SlyD [Reichenbachiella faecimaris]|uniref:Peptidyl-prolyl cis-trans isomerase n=1 Tax=Reichenbachiella faecimaris TaxID=692418 RepID=A0A1W2G6H2_REIFA|nr:FKBP-type peptidyl-prolyl cis-trans isomerase [Reichenbachiella faecimaris]SMD31948.1 FKBP-type peptidyl prolyl cis-trans isomerase /Apo-metallochaperone SlyD [Reichenbachiella faecimaris]